MNRCAVRYCRVSPRLATRSCVSRCTRTCWQATSWNFWRCCFTGDAYAADLEFDGWRVCVLRHPYFRLPPNIELHQAFTVCYQHQCNDAWGSLFSEDQVVEMSYSISWAEEAWMTLIVFWGARQPWFLYARTLLTPMSASRAISLPYFRYL